MFYFSQMKKLLLFLLLSFSLISGCTLGKETSTPAAPVQILDGRSGDYDQLLAINIHTVDAEESITEAEFRLDVAPVISWSVSPEMNAAAVTHYNVKIGKQKNSADMWEARRIPVSVSQVTYGETPAGAVETGANQDLEWGNYYVRVEAYADDQFLGFGDGGMSLK